MSLSSWVPTFWVAMMISRPLDTWWSNPYQSISSAADGSPIDRNVSLLLIILGFAILAKRGIQWSKVFRENQWLYIFYLYWLVSVLWSDYPFVAFKRWFRDASDVVVILVILTEEDPAEALRQVFLRCAYLLIPLSVLLMKYYVNIGRAYDQWTGAPVLGGVCLGKNQLGRLAMVSGLFLIWSLHLQEGSWFKKIRERWFDVAVLGLCVMILVQANSQTSFFCFCLGAFVFLVTRMKWCSTYPALLVTFMCLLITLSVVFFSVPDLRGIVTGALHRNVNLTERTDVWAGCFALDTNPLIGAGFGSVWLTPSAIALGNRLQIGEAHNGYLETYLNGGIIAVCLLLPILLVAGKSAVRHLAAEAATGPLYACLFVTGVIYNYTEAAFDVGNVVGFFLWIVAIQFQRAPETVVVQTQPQRTHQAPPGPVSSFGALLAKVDRREPNADFERKTTKNI